MSDQQWMFSTFHAVKKGSYPVKGIGSDNCPLQATGKGDIRIKSQVNGEWRNNIIYDVLFVPKLGANLFSVRAATKRGVKVVFDNDGVSITYNSSVVATGTSNGTNLYLLDFEPVNHINEDTSVVNPISLLSKTNAASINTWHHRLGHLNTATIKKMESLKVADGLLISSSPQPSICEGCVYGKHHHQPFPTGGRTRGTRIGDLIHSDLVGPMSIPSPSGSRYMVIFKDDFSGYCSIFFLKKKSETAEHFKFFVLRLEKETNSFVNVLRTDNGGEYTGGDFQKWIKSKGIRHETSIPKTPQQNGVSERQNRTIIESARSMITASNQSSELWAEASNCAVYLRNRVIGKSLPEMTPYEAWFGRKPNLSHLRMFGCPAYMHIPADERSKFSPKARKCVFVGYCETQKGFRLWDSVRRRIFVSRDVIFNEVIPDLTHQFSSDCAAKEEPCNPTVLPIQATAPPEDEETASDAIGVETTEQSTSNLTASKENDAVDSSSPSTDDLGPRKRRPPVRWADESTTGIYAGIAVDLDELVEPETYEEAIISPQSVEWKLAMEEEMNSLIKNETWSLVELPLGRAPIRNRWVYKIKRSGQNNVKFKARLVAKGFSQRPGIDYGETYSPVVKHDSLRTILSLAAAQDLELLQLDVKTAFLNGDIDEELYMDQPTGFKEDSQMVCLLKKGLYGLKQASRAWNEKFNHFLIQYGFTRSNADSCVYFQRDENNITIIAIWVDDGLLCSNLQSKLEDIVNYLSDKFEITSGPVDHFVGLEISRDRPKGLIHISQQAYVKKILARFRMGECKPRSVPADPCSHLEKELFTSETQDYPYREAIGSLMYAAICTRPDISYAVGQVAKYSSKPSQVHWEAVKRIFAYLKGTISLGISYFRGVKDGVLQAFSDSDFAGDADDRRSTTGNIFILNNGPVSWRSQKQKCVALSTAESEYIAASMATKEVVWLRRLLMELGCQQINSTPLFCDNQSAIRLVYNPEFHQRTKHIDVKFHHIRDMQVQQEISIQYIPTENQLADALTKNLDHQKLSRFKHSIGMCPFV
jgi:hypothetical protein